MQPIRMQIDLYFNTCKLNDTRDTDGYVTCVSLLCIVTLLPFICKFLFLVVPYVHVLDLVLAHVAVITLSDAPIAGYNPTLFLAGTYYYYYWYLFIICYYHEQVIS